MKDQLGRRIDYIRISITDRCNLRCGYCMPSCGVKNIGHSNILSYDEIHMLASVFVSLGIDKIKITGGEPFVRKGAVELIKSIREIPKLKWLSLTTNGTYLADKYFLIDELGLDGLNISLDTLDEEKYRRLTSGENVSKIIELVEHLGKTQRVNTKVNVVTLKDINYDDITGFAKLALRYPISVRFIELMPLGEGIKYAGYTKEDILNVLRKNYGDELNTNVLGYGPSEYVSFKNFRGSIGFISPMSHKFCDSCNRLRLSSDGMLKPCLWDKKSIDLKSILRANLSKEEMSIRLREAIIEGINIKPKEHHFNEEKVDSLMYQIGG